ncbi:MAG: amidase family protein [Paracoccaceae bacterium]
MNDAWLSMSAADLGRGISAATIDPVALCECYLAAIDAHPLGHRIYARATQNRALSEARAAAKRAANGTRRSVLDGVPISWKDLFDTAGTATEAGSALLAGRVPTKDARVLANATMAGLVCLGKTHMSELAFSGLGFNPITQTPPSVNYPDCVAGGSSSGAAASVAFGLAAGAVGSDTGGSVRIPAVWNDLVGLKTTSGLLSLQGVVPLVASFDTVGPLCRTVQDAALMLSALAGTPAPDLTAPSLKGMRFLILDNVVMDGLRDAPLAGFTRAIECLKQAGASVARHAVPVIDDAMALAGPLFTPEAYATWQQEIEAAPEKMYPAILKRFQSGKDFTAVQAHGAWQALDAHRDQWLHAVAGYDAVIMPTSASLPPNIDKLASDDDYYIAANLLALRNTRVANLMDAAALTLPTGVPATGISFLTPPRSEHRLLRIGAAAQAALA